MERQELMEFDIECPCFHEAELRGERTRVITLLGLLGGLPALVTDGFIEWANPEAADFGQQRLKEMIRGNRHRAAAKTISEPYSALLNFARCTPQADDLSTLVVKRR
jgi:serine phosphatase RsbU (regulator of sigma subunit)